MTGALGLGACRKENVPSQLEVAVGRHRALVMQGARPADKAFDEVLALLRSVPPDSRDAAEAKKLELAIEHARVTVRTPLAKVHASESDLPPDIAAQTRACAALAEQLARDAGAHPAMLRALDECRLRVERLEKAFHDAHEPADDDVSQRLELRMDAGLR